MTTFSPQLMDIKITLSSDEIYTCVIYMKDKQLCYTIYSGLSLINNASLSKGATSKASYGTV